MYKYNFIAEQVCNSINSIPFDDEGYFTEERVDFLIDENITLKNFDYSTGATKCVIIPEDTDYVIKIPFNAITSSCGYCDEEDSFNCCRSHCPMVHFEWGGGSDNDDYCALEEDLYEEIKEKYIQFLDFFLPTIKICEINNYPIYIQKKAEILEDKTYPVSEISKKKVMSCNYTVSAPIEWLAKCLEDMNNNLDMYNDFLFMLKDLGMAGDLHRGNVGYYNGHAVLIDYAGFMDK